MKKTTKWTDKHKDFLWEVNLIELQESPTYSPDPWYTSYFYIRKDKVPPETWDKLQATVTTSDFSSTPYTYFNYSDLGIVNAIEFHGGCTYYEHLFRGETKEVIGIKIGCDYNHSWDDGMHYDLEQIVYEIEAAIDSFIALIPEVEEPAKKST